MRIGAQLYTVYKHCQTLEDLAVSLQKVADIGYKYVQVSGTCECESGWLKEQLQRTGLECVITHISPEKLQGDIDSVIKWHKEVGCKYVGLGHHYFDQKDDSDYQKFLKGFTPAIKALAAADLQFMYHNHHQEFKRLPNGNTVIEQMCEDFAPNELGITADTFWMQVGGVNPAEWIGKLNGRVPCIHLKDYMMRSWTDLDAFNFFAPIGEGNINFDAVFQAAEQSGTQYMLVEQDNSYGEDPFDCLKRSYDFLHSKGFE